MIRFFLIFTICFFNLHIQQASSNVAIGKCIVIVEQNNVENSVVNATDIGCPQDPNKALRVKYFWLDSNSFSLLHQGVDDEGLASIIGNSPFVINTPANRAFSSLLKDFGSKIDQNSLFQGHHRVMRTSKSGGSDATEQTILCNACATDDDPVSTTLLTPTPVYDAMDIIYFPEIDSMRTLFAEDSWPSNFDKAYIPADLYSTNFEWDLEKEQFSISEIQSYLDDPDFVSEVYRRTILWRELSSNDLKNYFVDARAVSKKLNDSSSIVLHPPPWPNSYEFESEPYDVKGSEHGIYKITKFDLSDFSNNSSVKAMRHFTKDGMPKDFMKVYGYMESHGGDELSWSFFSIPRRPYVQIAVIENIGGAGALYDVPGFVVQTSDSNKLRFDETYGQEEILSFPPGKLGAGDVVVVPLKIELRDHQEVGRVDYPVEITPVNDRLLERFFASASSVSEQLNISNFRTPLLKKRLRTFSESSAPQASKHYLYGAAVTLNSVIVDGKQWPVRQFDPNNTYMVAGWEGGSCPFLYVNLTTGERVKIGRILRTANGPENSQSQWIELGNDLSGIEIIEEEPERGTITDIQLFQRLSNGSLSKVLAYEKDTVLEFGEVLKIDLENANKGGYVARITGYYEPYNTLAISN